VYPIIYLLDWRSFRKTTIQHSLYGRHEFLHNVAHPSL